MEKREFYRTFFSIAIPVMIQFLITSSVNIMDSLMIGKLGEEAVAALGIANQYYFLFNLITMGIYSGGGVLISQFWGGKDEKSIKKVLGITMIIGIVTSILFLGAGVGLDREIIGLFNKDESVLTLGGDYLKIVSLSYVFMVISYAYGIGSRSIGRAFLPMLASALALIINIFLNYAFIFGHFGIPALGVKGAAIATFISRLIEMIVILIFIYGKNEVLAASFKEMKTFNREFFIKTVGVVVPVVINELCWGFGMIAYSMIYGRMGTRAIAAVQICMTLQNMFMIILFAVANSSCVMVGNKVGAMDFEGAKVYSKRFMKISIVLSILMAGSLILSASWILGFYEVSKEVYDSALYMLYISALIFPIRFINALLIVGILRGGGDTKYALKIELATMWLVGVPVCLVGTFLLKLKIYEVFALVTLEEIAKFIGCTLRYKYGDWIKSFVEEEENNVQV